MVYVVIGAVGCVAVIVGLALGVSGSTVGGWIVGSAGSVLTAIGLIGFGFQQRREWDSPARRLADEEAAERLAERRAAEDRENTKAEDRHRAELLRLTQLRDIDRIRRAILAELDRLQPGVSLAFRWGRTADTLEIRSYAVFPDQGLFHVLMDHAGRHAQYAWPPGGMPRPIGPDHLPEGDPENTDDVEHAYALLQPERYLVREHLGADEQLELAAPGYFRHGQLPKNH